MDASQQIHGHQEQYFIPYTEEQVNEVRRFSIDKQKIQLLLDILETTRECDMPMLSLEAKIINKIDDIIDNI